MNGSKPGRDTPTEDIPDKLEGASLGRDLNPLVQAVIVILPGRAVIHQDQVAVGLVGILVQCVIANIASRIIGKAGCVDDVVALVEADAQRRTALGSILRPPLP